MTGSLLQQLEDAYGYIDRFNRTRAEFSGLDRVDIRDYPPEAVREALLNALVHRDYAFSGPTLISIFEDRIEFVTIGGLARGIGLEDIRLGVSVLRNPNLANIFYRLRLIEAYGTGILRIHECYAGAAVQPAIEATDHAFKITPAKPEFQPRSRKYPACPASHQFGQERGPGAEGHRAVQRERLGRPEGRGGGAGRLPGHGDPAVAGDDPGRSAGKARNGEEPAVLSSGNVTTEKLQSGRRFLSEPAA